MLGGPFLRAPQSLRGIPREERDIEMSVAGSGMEVRLRCSQD
jgi:hypothetical protein